MRINQQINPSRKKRRSGAIGMESQSNIDKVFCGTEPHSVHSHMDGE
ncbi:hypothetical protein H6S82_15385 [Planktothrix sp. FACHB-1355]|uniref:Uncharacterized protein n=1 Tax=Aerosakkonema funiforme FACHB-1375 TaxID=2949571 RepID=A0A926VM70_9CYAN|nr:MULTISPECIES: hypothetical protein [Oscillatoriales]MBD2186461.1 hypothetical protein [Aerosakkonema funiforme FACHB-1375]MBD3560224.1 hypothetical protein [Planktothrix sp. FACHB-1355]